MIINYNSKLFLSLASLLEQNQIHVFGAAIVILFIVSCILGFNSSCKARNNEVKHSRLSSLLHYCWCHIPWRKPKIEPIPGCQSFSSNDSESDGLEEDILLAISTLFQECEDDDESDEIQTNTIVARIVPRNRVEFQNHKILERQVDASKLRESIEEKFSYDKVAGKDIHFSRSEDNQDMVVALEVDATVPSTCDPKRRYRLRMNMNRPANELAHRFLSRLSISLRRKIKQEDKKLEKVQNCQHAGRRSSRVAEEKYFYHKQGLKKKKGQQIDELKVCATIWISQENSSGSGSKCCDGKEENFGEYDAFDFNDNVTVASLWEDIAAYDSSMLCMDLLDSTNDRDHSTVCLRIISCPPTILSVRAFEDFEASVFVGVPLVIGVELLHATHAVVTWFVDGSAVSHDSVPYTPCLDDIGKSISVLVVPVRYHHNGQGSEEAYCFLNKVEPLPFMPLVSPLRESWNGDRRSGDHLRVMTYNILADLYAARELDQHVMYNHCPIEFLCRKRRMPMLVFEILYFRPDIVCLQEVDVSVFDYLLQPTLESQGYQGYYSNKASAQLEGCAMFWSLQTFQRLDRSALRHFHLKDLFSAHGRHLDHWDSLGDIDRLLNSNSELSRITKEKVGQVLQVAELKLQSPSSTKPERILVGNTHLFYHPLANHVRTMQAYMICRQMEAERERVGYPCPLVICGDLNADPLSGAVQLLSQGRVGPENYDAWRHLDDYHWEMGEEQFLLEHQYIGNEAGCSDPLYEDEAFEDAFEDPEEESTHSQGPQISLPPTFPKLVSAYPDIPEFTNFAVDFVETLDYIFVSQPSAVEPFGFIPFKAAPMPLRSEVEPFLGMPNENMPSDHVSLISDLEWGCVL